MILRLTIVSLIFVILMSACGADLSTGNNASSVQKPTQEQAAPLPTDTHLETAPAADPIEINVILRESDVVEGLMPLEGGKLSAKAKDGTVFTLEIPADTLLEPVNVRMTPIEQVENLPFGAQQTYAVQLEPEGLVLYNHFATLTIETPAPIQLEEQIFFGYQNAGKDVFLAAPDKDTQAMKILLSHFSGYGVTKGLLSDTEPVRERLGGSYETRLQSKIAEAVIRERQRLQNGGSEDDSTLAQEVDPIVQDYYENVVQPRIAAAGESCAAARLALDTAMLFVRQMMLLGNAEPYSDIDLAGLGCSKGLQ